MTATIEGDTNGERLLRVSRWVMREPVEDLDKFPLSDDVREQMRRELAPVGAKCYLFNALRRSMKFRGAAFSDGIYVDAESERFINALLQDPVAANKDAPYLLSRVLLHHGILTYSDADDEAARWDALDASLPDQPGISWIEITNRCKMTCSFCDRSEMRRKVADMAPDSLERALQQTKASGQTRVQLYGLGEPLLHPDLPRFVRMTAEAGLVPGFSCVPVELEPALAEALFEAGLGSINFSIDTLDPEAFLRIRGPKADLKRALANIDNFLEQNTKRGKPVHTTVRMISLNENDGEAAAFRAYWSQRDIDVIYVRPFGIHEHHSEKRRANYQQLRGAWTSLKLCSWPWQSAVLTVDGQLQACCLRSSGPMAMGSWQTGTIHEIWHGDGYRQLRASLKLAQFDAEHPCATCTHAPHNVKAMLDRAAPTCVDEIPAVGWEF